MHNNVSNSIYFVARLVFHNSVCLMELGIKNYRKTVFDSIFPLNFKKNKKENFLTLKLCRTETSSNKKLMYIPTFVTLLPYSK